MEEIKKLVNRLNEAETAEKVLKSTKEELAKPIRVFIRKAICDYFDTKELMIVLADSGAFTGYTQSRDNFTSNRILCVSGKCGYSLTFPQVKMDDGTWKTTDCMVSWSLSMTPEFEFDLTGNRWMNYGKQYALNYLNDNTWCADGYIQLKTKAKRLNMRTETMKSIVAYHAEQRIANVKEKMSKLVD